MSVQQSPGTIRAARVLVIGMVTTVLVLGLTSIMLIYQQSGSLIVTTTETNALENSKDACVECHREVTAGIVHQFGHSAMAYADVTCRDCHQVPKDYPAAVAHEGTYVLGSPTTSMCQDCHETEVAEFYQSRHSLPAYVAVAGTMDLDENMLAFYKSIPEGTFAPDQSRNAIAELEGDDLTPFTCESCHNIGKPAADASVGQCQKCHLRHQFSLEQARKPETCNYCHIGPDHPQWEIYQESPHGITYMTSGDDWNWDVDPGTLTVSDFPAPTCAVCHMSSFGASRTTHDVGDRLTWYLFAPTSERRPDWENNMKAMQNVCLECHNEKFISDFYAAADRATVRVNELVAESNEVITPLVDNDLLTDEPFDEPVDFIHFNLWHHWGRTTKFGVWMQGPDYSQWHGAYEVLHDLSELRQIVREKLQALETE